MSDIVADSSLVAALLLLEKDWQALGLKIHPFRKVVPGLLLRYEVCNAISKRRQSSPKDRTALMQRMWSAPLVEIPHEEWLAKAIEISTGFRSSFTDSCFIAVASLRKLPLWTLDQLQADAARAAGVRVELI